MGKQGNRENRENGNGEIDKIEKRGYQRNGEMGKMEEVGKQIKGMRQGKWRNRENRDKGKQGK